MRPSGWLSHEPRTRCGRRRGDLRCPSGPPSSGTGIAVKAIPMECPPLPPPTVLPGMRPCRDAAEGQIRRVVHGPRRARCGVVNGERCCA